MSASPPTLHMLCGKMASGKSTLAARLGEAGSTLTVSEDVWLEALFADQLSSGSDYVRCAAKLQKIMEPHVQSILNAGLSVVLDFPANTVESRKWMRAIVERSNVAHELHVLNTPDDVCLARLQARNAEGRHPFAPTEEQFHQFSRHFAVPTADEGFNLIFHDVG